MIYTYKVYFQQSETVSDTIQPPWKKARTEKSVLCKCVDDTVQSTNVDNQWERSAIETQLTRYLSEPVIGRMENPLTWCRQNKERLPDLARLAGWYLGPPPTCVPSERLFSVAGEVISDHRSALLLPDSAVRLIFMKYDIKLIDDWLMSDAWEPNTLSNLRCSCRQTCDFWVTKCERLDLTSDNS